jgi:hypothetical protein
MWSVTSWPVTRARSHGCHPRPWSRRLSWRSFGWAWSCRPHPVGPGPDRVPRTSRALRRGGAVRLCGAALIRRSCRDVNTHRPEDPRQGCTDRGDSACWWPRAHDAERTRVPSGPRPPTESRAGVLTHSPASASSSTRSRDPFGEGSWPAVRGRNACWRARATGIRMRLLQVAWGFTPVHHAGSGVLTVLLAGAAGGRARMKKIDPAAAIAARMSNPRR